MSDSDKIVHAIKDATFWICLAIINGLIWHACSIKLK